MVLLTTIVKDVAKDDEEIAQILFGSTIKDFELKIKAFDEISSLYESDPNLTRNFKNIVIHPKISKG